MTELQYNVVCDWNRNHSVKNFLRLYKHGFNYKWLLWRPIWRIWRIFRNTVLSARYIQLERQYKGKLDDELVSET